MQTATWAAASSGGSDPGHRVGLSRPGRTKSRLGREHHDKPIEAVLATNVRKHRQGRGWSIEVLAERCQLPPTCIAAIEEGSREVRLGTVETVARALQIDIAGLFSPLEDSGRGRGQLKASKDRPRKLRAP